VIHITDAISIPDSEVTFTASRSGGPGGQNVNKVSTKITLAFHVRSSAALSDDQKRRIEERLARRINSDGVLQVISQRTRSQEMNRTDAMERFAELLKHALAPRRARVKTRMPKTVKEQRLQEKKRHSVKKQTRSGKGWD
jgi:ribosome-associated protein